MRDARLTTRVDCLAQGDVTVVLEPLEFIKLVYRWPKIIDTVLGPVTVRRASFHCGQCGHGVAAKARYPIVTGAIRKRATPAPIRGTWSGPDGQAERHDVAQTGATTSSS